MLQEGGSSTIFGAEIGLCRIFGLDLILDGGCLDAMQFQYPQSTSSNRFGKRI